MIFFLQIICNYILEFTTTRCICWLSAGFKKGLDHFMETIGITEYIVGDRNKNRI